MEAAIPAEPVHAVSGWKYEETPTGAVLTNGGSGPISMVKVQENTPAGWQKAGRAAGALACPFFEVTLDPGKDLDEGLKNLQYFFILADRIPEAAPSGDGTAPRPGMLVRLSRKSDVYKLKTYLAMLSQQEERYHLLYTLNGRDCLPIQPTPEETNIQLGKLFPLLHVVADRNAQLPGEIPLSALLHTSTPDQEDGRFLLADHEIMECFDASDKPTDIWRKDLRQCCAAILRGTASALKDRKPKVLGEYICGRRTDMTLMAQLQWFFQLQLLAKNHVLLDENGAPAEFVLEKSRQDAVACAEGLVQILENSCQHSNRRSAYLSMRLHEVSLDETLETMMEHITNRRKIISRYQRLWKQGRTVDDGMTWKNKDVLLRDAGYYYEIDVADDASAGGIADRYPRHEPENGGSQELIDIFADRCCIDPAHTVLPYGLQALCQHIRVNSGCFLVSSPHGEDTEMVLFRSGEDLWQRRITGKTETTEYHILMPLGLKEPEPDLRKASPPAADAIDNMLDLSYLKDPKKNEITVHMERIDMLPCADGTFPDQKYKNDGVNTYAERIEQILTALADRANTICLLDIRGLDDVHTEIFSKALFRKIMTGDSPSLLALFFKNSLQQQITIRMCSVFCRRCRNLLKKVTGIAPTPGVQMALCSQSALGYPEVNMILNLQDWISLRETAIRYAYNNLAASHRLYAQIKYFLYAPGKEEPADAPVTKVFPFDLYLKDTPDTQAGTEKRCWFLQSIQSMLNRDLQREGKDGGIKIRNIHVHLPTNVHMEAFHSADLLFRNVAYVSRFAYLLALRLLEDDFLRDDKNALIVCYEAYSSLLMQYLEYFLNQSVTPPDSEREDRVRAAMVYRENKHSARMLLPADLEQKRHADPKYFSDWKFIVLSPIATTLSTVHLLHELISRECTAVKHSNVRDYTIILVGQEDDGVHGIKIQERFWDMRDTEHVGLHGRLASEPYPVGYLVHVAVAWHDPDDCGPFTDHTLVHADTTSTELKLLFPRKLTDEESGRLVDTNKELCPDLQDPEHWQILHRHDVCSLLSPAGISKPEHQARLDTNNRRLPLLKGCIQYSHIVRSSNHYAYFMEFSKLYEHIRSGDERKNWTSWLESLRKSHRRDVLTVLVAPLRLGISPFLKDLIDHVFTESIHVIQLDMHSTRRLDMLTKYCYVAESCKEALKADPSLELHVHYIDDSIVSADTLRRGRSMVDLLLRNAIPADVMASRVKLFRGVYVMLNRSSRDTIQSLVEDPDRDYHAYIHLAVPHFNTHSDHCPSCARAEKFDFLKKCSVTNRLAGEFLRLAEKHTKRTPEEYTQWQMQQLYGSRSCFLRLRQWVYSHKGRPPAGLKKEYDLVRDHLNELKKLTFEDILLKYNDMTKRENRTIWQQNQAILEAAAREGTLRSAKIKLRPLMPRLTSETELLYALNSRTAYRQLYAAQNPNGETLTFQHGRAEIPYIPVVETEEAADAQHERIRQEFLKALGELKLSDHVHILPDPEKTRAAYERIWFDGVLADQAYRRTMAVHEAFSSLLLEKEPGTVEQMRAMILKFLCSGSAPGGPKVKDPRTAVEIIERWEWLHSAFKVLSRNELVHYHMVRAVMFGLLKECAQVMLDVYPGHDPRVEALFTIEKGGKPKTLAGDPDKNIDCLMRYQLFSGILRRLADLQSSYPIDTLANGLVLSRLQVLTEQFFKTDFSSENQKPNGSRWFYCTIPSQERMIASYEKCIKLSTMAEDDETKSNQIQKHFTAKASAGEGG